MKTKKFNSNDPGHHPFSCVTLKRYSDITGETKAAVRSRIQRGEWAEGIHYQRDPYNHIWIIPEGVDTWIMGE